MRCSPDLMPLPPCVMPACDRRICIVKWSALRSRHLRTFVLQLKLSIVTIVGVIAHHSPRRLKMAASLMIATLTYQERAYVAPTDSQMFTEVFPIQLEALPPITAYRLIYANVESVSERSQLDRKMGGKLTYRLRHALGGTWVWLAGHILTDSPPNPVKLIMVVDEAKRDQKTLYKELESIEEDYGWQMNAEEIAEFVVRGPLQALEPHIQAALAKTAIPLRNARVEREFRARSWVVNGHPSISLSVVSRLLYEPDVETFAATLPKVTDLVGL